MRPAKGFSGCVSTLSTGFSSCPLHRIGCHRGSEAGKTRWVILTEGCSTGVGFVTHGDEVWIDALPVVVSMTMADLVCSGIGLLFFERAQFFV